MKTFSFLSVISALFCSILWSPVILGFEVSHISVLCSVTLVLKFHFL